jgi:hypothetical protein
MALLFVVMNHRRTKAFTDDEIDTQLDAECGLAGCEGRGQPSSSISRPGRPFLLPRHGRWFGVPLRGASCFTCSTPGCSGFWRGNWARAVAASLATFFFAFHGAFDALLKPTRLRRAVRHAFLAASILEGRYLLSFAAFWLAYKSSWRDAAGGAGWLSGSWEKRWALLPFLLASLSGRRALLNPPGQRLHSFTAAALAKTSVFYAGRSAGPRSGLRAGGGAVPGAKPRAWFGLPGRRHPLPLSSSPAGCSARTASAAGVPSPFPRSPERPVSQAGFCRFGFRGLPAMRRQRHAKLAKDDEVRAWWRPASSPIAAHRRVCLRRGAGRIPTMGHRRGHQVPFPRQAAGNPLGGGPGCRPLPDPRPPSGSPLGRPEAGDRQPHPGDAGRPYVTGRATPYGNWATAGIRPRRPSVDPPERLGEATVAGPGGSGWANIGREQLTRWEPKR